MKFTSKVLVASLRILFFSIILGMSLTASAFAEQNQTELMVRFKRGHSISQSKLFNLATDSRILNAREGVVKFKFKNREEAQAARASMLSSGEVANVSPNFLYRLAIHLEAQDVPNAATFLAAPFATANLENAVTIFDTIPAVQLPGPVTPGLDSLAAQDWAIQQINMPSVDAVNALQTGAPLIAAVIDTGVDYNHEDLIGAMWRNPSNPQEVGYDFAHNNDTPYDVRHFDIDGCLKDKKCASGQTQSQYLTNPGHGTHCAGHVGAVANNSLGIRGVGGNVQVMALKFFYDYTDGANAGAGDDAAAVQSIDYAIANGVKVISASWGGRMNPAEAEQSELKQAIMRAQQAGILFVVAAGNDSIDNDSDVQPDYPAAYNLDNILVVAASDSNDALASFSNYGGKSVQIGAPGVKIFSTTVQSTYDDVVVTYTQSGQSKSLNWDGTSMATPIVAGAAALIWSKYPNETYLQIKNRILQSARAVPALAGKVTTSGVLDVSAALGI